MERIRQRLLDESASIAKSEARRREREGKKIGKQVQLEKLKERERSKKDMEERLKGLKRSTFLSSSQHSNLFIHFKPRDKKEHKGALQNAQADDDGFDVAVEDAIADRRPAKRARGGKAGAGGSLPRHARDKKFGFGGHGKRDKQNTRSSTDDLDGPARRGGGGGMRGRGRGRGGSSRLGKSRRVAAKSR